MAKLWIRNGVAVLTFVLVAASTHAQAQTPPTKLGVPELAARIPKVMEGDSMSQVLQLLGTPDRINPETPGRREMWLYINSSFILSLEFEGNLLSKKTTRLFMRPIQL